MDSDLFSRAAEAAQGAAGAAGEVADAAAKKVQEAANAVAGTAVGAVGAVGGAASATADNVAEAMKSAKEGLDRKKAEEVSMYHVETDKALERLSEKELSEKGEFAPAKATRTTKKLTLAELAAMGAGFGLLAESFKGVALQLGALPAGGETLYRWSAPSLGALPFARNDGMGFLSATTGPNGLNQGSFVPVKGGLDLANAGVVPIDPVTLFIAAAVANMDRKLDDIEEMQRDILDFMEEKERAKHIGNMNVLNEVMETYRHNWDNEKFKDAKLHLVQQIKRDAEQAIVFRRGRISRGREEVSPIHGDMSVNAKLGKLIEDFDQYQLALYEFGYAWFIEVMLLGNFEEGYLSNVRDKMADYSLQYRTLYTECFDQLVEESGSTVESMLLGGVSVASGVLGKAIGSIPVIKEGPVDEALIDAGGKVGDYRFDRVAESLSRMGKTSNTCITPFIDNVDDLNTLYNKPFEVCFDSEDVYFELPE